jgi:hypothetical protein
MAAPVLRTVVDSRLDTLNDSASTGIRPQAVSILKLEFTVSLLPAKLLNTVVAIRPSAS